MIKRTFTWPLLALVGTRVCCHEVFYWLTTLSSKYNESRKYPTWWYDEIAGHLT
ncbi:hypothetical protein ACEV60_10560 [Enterobacter ludwigii]|uniref:hypothetical protein n=1 Tax=Enterobacter TaxID=547 RepID=UPI003BEF4188